MASQTQAVLEAAEVTQSVQDLHHTVTLIAGKATVVRVYVSCSDGPVAAARGWITVRRSPADPAVALSSLNSVFLDPADPNDLAARRGDAALSLNFLLPPALTTEGPLSVSEVTVADSLSGGALPLSGPPGGPTVWFHPGPPLRVRVLGLRYSHGDPPVTHTPRGLDFLALVSWLKRAYPVPDVISSHSVIDVGASGRFSCEDVNAQLAAIRALDMGAGGDPRTHYFGQVADGGFFMRGCSSGIPGLPDPGTIASAPTGSADFGWDFDGTYGDWYGAHELGHTLGRKHPGFCDQTQDDLQNYPFEHGQLADTEHAFVGFDVGDPALHLPMKALPGLQWHDVMTYCDRQWLSSYTYEGLRTRLLAENDLAVGGPPPERAPQPVPVHTTAGPAPGGSGGRPDERFPVRPVVQVTRSGPAEAAGPVPDAAGGGAPAEQLVSVVGTVNLSRREGGIRFVNPVPAQARPPSPPSPSGMGGDGGETPVVLRIRQADGAPPREIPVPVKLASELGPDDDRTGLIDTIASVGQSPDAIELVVGGRVVDTFRAAGPPPALRATRHAGAHDGTLGMALEFDRGPEAGQTYSAQVSGDGGRSWQTIGVGLKDPVVHVDRGQFRPGAEVRLRITTTNGFTSTTAETEAFPV